MLLLVTIRYCEVECGNTSRVLLSFALKVKKSQKKFWFALIPQKTHYLILIISALSYNMDQIKKHTHIIVVLIRVEFVTCGVELLMGHCTDIPADQRSY